MFARKAVLLALWSIACGAVPALATLDPVVKPAINRVPERPQPYVTPNNPVPFNPQPIKADPRNALIFDDGRKAPAEAVCERIVSPYATKQVACCQYGESGGVGFWGRGPVRRFIARPFRWFRRGRC